ncbi:MAG: ATPase domain-containing protein [Thermoproteota archaeon]
MSSQSIPTLCHGLDSILDGGVRRGDVNLFFGARGIGKTCLSIQIAVSNSILGYETFFIFCQGNFPTERLIQIAQGYDQEVSNLIHIATPKSFSEQLRLLERFELELYEHPSASLLVIDSIDSLYALQLSLQSSLERDRYIFEKSFQLNKHLGLVRNVSRARNVCTVITCNAKSSSGNVFEEPVSARLMEYWSDNIVELIKEPSGSFFRPIKLRRCREVDRQTLVQYKIVEKGIVDHIEDVG